MHRLLTKNAPIAICEKFKLARQINVAIISRTRIVHSLFGSKTAVVNKFCLLDTGEIPFDRKNLKEAN
jgi:hypothetical protein